MERGSKTVQEKTNQEMKEENTTIESFLENLGITLTETQTFFSVQNQKNQDLTHQLNSLALWMYNTSRARGKRVFLGEIKTGVDIFFPKMKFQP